MNKIQKVYCYDGDKLFSTIDEIVEILGFENEDEIINSFPNGLPAFECNLQPIHQFNIDEIIGLIDERYFPAYHDDEIYEEIYDLLKTNINIDKINKGIPKVYFISPKKTVFSMEELLNEFKKNKENEPS